MGISGGASATEKSLFPTSGFGSEGVRSARLSTLDSDRCSRDVRLALESLEKASANCAESTHFYIAPNYGSFSLPVQALKSIFRANMTDMLKRASEVFWHRDQLFGRHQELNRFGQSLYLSHSSICCT